MTGHKLIIIRYDIFVLYETNLDLVKKNIKKIFFFLAESY